jgi:pyrroloquinoline-quinone synthase
MEADIRHTASWQKIIEQASEQYYLTNVMIDAAERSLICQNILLDSCYEEYC